MNKIISSKIIVLTFGVLVVCFLAAFYVVAWQEPSQAPPEGNAPTPLNTSATAQTKEGDLTIQGFLSTLKNFIVGNTTIKSDGTVSPNLNSDKLDDYHAADLMAQAGGKAIYYLRCAFETYPQCYSYYYPLPSMWCTPPNCAAGDTSLGTGCVITDIDWYPGDPLGCGAGGSSYFSHERGGYCERVCRDE